jgi:hypothetical protein
MKHARLLLVALFLIAQITWARGNAELQVDDTEVGLTQVFQVRMEVDEEITDAPAFKSASGIKILGQSSGPFHSMQIVNGQVTTRNGTIVTWTVRADQLGKQRIGPVTYTTKSGTHVAPAITVEVSKTAHPMDPFARAMRGLSLIPDAQEEDNDPADPSLAVEGKHPLDFFVHARADKDKVVIGEQLTVTYDIYLAESQREPDLFDLKEATCDQCLVFDHTEQRGGRLGIGMVDGRRYVVKRIRKTAFFPLGAGAIRIAPLSLVGGTRRVKRESNAIDVAVVEPPKAGRPGGYTLGDTGAFELGCEVSGDTVEAGGTVIVTAKVSGSGNFPSKLQLPHVRGLNFLEPEVREAIGPNGEGLRAGSKTFTYAVRAEVPGKNTLGSIQWPVFDPKRESYRTLSCSLGALRVTGTAAASAEPSIPLKAPIAALEGAPAAAAAPSGMLWAGMLGLPIVAGVILAVPARKKKRATRSNAKQFLAAAKKTTDQKEAARLLVRALDEYAQERHDARIGGLSRSEAELVLPPEAHAWLATRADLEALGYDPALSLETLRARVEAHLQ